MFVRRLAGAALISLITAGSAPAIAAKLQATCKTNAAAGAEKIICQVRSNDGKSLTDVTAASSGGKRLEGKLETYSSSSNDTAWYFLVQQSGVTAAHLDQMSHAIASLASFSGRRRIGVATFADQTEERAELGSNSRQWERAVRQIRAASPNTQAPALHKAARDAIMTLDAFPASRKSLVLLSNGASDAGTITDQEIIDLALGKGVVIYGLMFGDRTTGRPQSITRLADQTFGQSRDFAGKPDSDVETFATNFHDLLENGVAFEFDKQSIPANEEITFSARLRDNTTVTAAPMVLRTQEPSGEAVDVKTWISENFAALLAIAALAAGLVLVGNSLMRGKTETPAGLWPMRTAVPSGLAGYERGLPGEAAEDGGTVILTPTNDRSPPETVHAWLQFMDGSSARVPIGATSVRIGRHNDNDICLINNSVHRQHAVLHMSANGNFVIRDLGTKNGVIVNGVRSNQRELTDGDLIELGEVRLRFFSNKV